MTALEPTITAADLNGGRPALGAWAYFEGSVVPIGEATVSIATHTFNYGTAVFEGIRAYRQEDGSTALLFGLEHYERLLRNARLLRASVPETAEALVEITRELLRRNEHIGDVYIRPLVYKSAHSIRVQLTGLDDRIGIFTMPLGDYLPTGGIRVTVSGWQRVSDNAISARGKISGSYVNAAFASEDAHAAGYDDALLLTADGHVAEASAANIFVVRGREVATPPLVDDVLPGITRQAVIEIARDAGHEVVERRIDRSELYLADEVFLTGTGVQVAPIASIDDRPIGSPDFPVALDIQRRYFAAVRGTDPRYAHWLSPI
jgi:branched-chain amino acid aminotransferase